MPVSCHTASARLCVSRLNGNLYGARRCHQFGKPSEMRTICREKSNFCADTSRFCNDFRPSVAIMAPPAQGLCAMNRPRQHGLWGIRVEFVIGGQTIAVNVPTWAALEARVAERLAQRKGFALATINLDHLVKLSSDAAFQRAYAAQDFVVADGNPIVWMSRLAGRPVALIPGSDAILPLVRIAARQGVSVALVGSTDTALARAKSHLEREVRDLRINTCIAPPMGFDAQSADADAVFDQLRASGAGLCFIALGAPKQEIFAAVGREKLPAMGFACIGAGLDFFAGTQRRAPDWAQRFAVEWLWRMLSSPKRLGPRYAKCIAILPGQMIRAALLRLRTGRA